jgi:hypothetical protein
VKVKKHYKVVLNWYGELQTFYTCASNEHIAYSNAIIQLAEKLSLYRTIVNLRFLHPGRYKVTEIKKEEEENEK